MTRRMEEFFNGNTTIIAALLLALGFLAFLINRLVAEYVRTGVVSNIYSRTDSFPVKDEDGNIESYDKIEFFYVKITDKTGLLLDYSIPLRPIKILLRLRKASETQEEISFKCRLGEITEIFSQNKEEKKLESCESLAQQA